MVEKREPGSLKISQRRFRRFLRRPVRSILSPPLFLFLCLPLNLGGPRNTILSRGCTDTSAFHFFPLYAWLSFSFCLPPFYDVSHPTTFRPSCFSTSLFPVFFSVLVVVPWPFLYTLRRGSTGLVAPWTTALQRGSLAKGSIKRIASSWRMCNSSSGGFEGISNRVFALMIFRAFLRDHRRPSFFFFLILLNLT